MKKKWIIPVVCLALAGAAIIPQPSIATYIDRTTTVVLDAQTLGENDSVSIELGDLSGYGEVWIKVLATTWQDSLAVRFASSENAGWDTGNTAYFDYDPSTVIVDHWELSTKIGTFGKIIPIRDKTGSWLTGNYGLMRVVNENLVDEDVVGFTVIVIKRR